MEVLLKGTKFRLAVNDEAFWTEWSISDYPAQPIERGSAENC